MRLKLLVKTDPKGHRDRNRGSTVKISRTQLFPRRGEAQAQKKRGDLQSRENKATKVGPSCKVRQARGS